MGKSAGPGSPVFFMCAAHRREYWRTRSRDGHRVTLTGRTKPYPHRRGSMLGQRSTRTSREYRCSCGHVGWSNHIDLARVAGEGRDV